MFTTDEEWNERLRVLEDARNLKKLARFFLHPEESVKTNGLQARCFFDRASAPERLSVEEVEEQQRIMEDLKSRKSLPKFLVERGGVAGGAGW